MIIKKSLEHLKENRMTYWQHFVFANSHGFRCVVAGISLMIHAIIPAFLSKTGSELVYRLNQSFKDHLKMK